MSLFPLPGSMTLDKADAALRDIRRNGRTWFLLKGGWREHGFAKPEYARQFYLRNRDMIERPDEVA